MADNIGVTPGTGSTVAADDIAGVLHQRVKMVIGADGVSDGDISSTNPMPITGITTSNIGTIGGIATEVTLDAIHDKITTTAIGVKVDSEVFDSEFSSTNLAATETYTSAWFDTTLYGAGANAYYRIDRTTSYSYEISEDQIIIDSIDSSTTNASQKFQETQYIPTRYWRFKVTNTGATTSTSTFISVSCRKIPILESIKISDRLGNDLTFKAANAPPLTTELAIPIDNRPNIQLTYSASFTGAITATSATDVFTMSGVTGKKIRIKSFYISGEQTNSSVVRVNFIKRSSLNTAGTSTTQTNVAHSSDQAASSAVVKAYTANPTLGTAVGTFQTQLIRINLVGSTPSPIQFIPTESLKDYTLLSASEVFAVNFNSATLTGNNVSINITWTEE